MVEEPNEYVALAVRRRDGCRDYDDDDWSALWWVRMSRRGRVLDSGTTREKAIDLLADKYRQYREPRPAGPVLVIDVAQISGWQATIG